MASGTACAGVVIGGTRVIYSEKDREVTVKVTNHGDTPSLVQAWIDAGDPKDGPDVSKAPFTLAPPLFRLDANKGQSLRLIYTRDPLPRDRESLFWLNVLEIPPKAKLEEGASSNHMQFAFRSRIKFFFRPAGLPGAAEDAPAKIAWRLVRQADGQCGVEATNPTPYHVTLTKIVISEGDRTWANDRGAMVDPRAAAVLNAQKGPRRPTGPTQIDYTFLNDYGAAVSGTAGLGSSQNVCG
ncbi:fimbrial biogenesis chaperone [Phenylobacterium sp.]|uniref:fimbrial biogenesis chaperone n=1 Tax=Phenylobacterium sp. TaxID=1871053 RepID=UPI002F40022C